MNEEEEKLMSEKCKCGHQKIVHGMTGGYDEFKPRRPLGSCSECECEAFSKAI